MPTLLVPTDFSKNAANALQYAASLATHSGGRLLLVHTVDLLAAYTPEGLPLLSIDTQLIEDAEEQLQVLAQELRQTSSFEVETFCLFGPLIPHLKELVKTQAVDLVVMGTQGASDLLSRLVGSNTSAFIKEAHCPVLVVPAQATFSPIRHIAYATDFETEETVYLKQLFQLAEGLKSEVHLINVKSEKQLNILSDYQVLTQINKSFPQNKYSVAQLRHEDVVAGLKEFVQDNDMDLLAVSIQDRGLLEDFFHRSVTKQLALQAFTPLLTLPAEPYHFQNQRPASRKVTPVG